MKSTIIKILSSIAITSLATLTNANTQNVWVTTFAQGNSDFEIQNNKNQSLGIYCNTSLDTDFEHSVYFSDNKKNGENMSELEFNRFKSSLSFKIDGKALPFPPEKTMTKVEAQAWKNFTSSIGKAQKIEIIQHGKSIASFFPTFKSMENIKNITICAPMRELKHLK